MPSAVTVMWSPAALSTIAAFSGWNTDLNVHTSEIQGVIGEAQGSEGVSKIVPGSSPPDAVTVMWSPTELNTLNLAPSWSNLELHRVRLTELFNDAAGSQGIVKLIG